MKKVINENDIRKSNNLERCQMILAIIKRTSNIYTKYKNSLRRKSHEQYNQRNKERKF